MVWGRSWWVSTAATSWRRSSGRVVMNLVRRWNRDWCWAAKWVRMRLRRSSEMRGYSPVAADCSHRLLTSWRRSSGSMERKRFRRSRWNSLWEVMCSRIWSCSSGDHSGRVPVAWD
uniref:(northern house mosquito) hypothetical protein n=1 Tax=Culex pipiens TaxID=7175 RepID=A0A8D8B1T6_CULPI